MEHTLLGIEARFGQKKRVVFRFEDKELDVCERSFVEAMKAHAEKEVSSSEVKKKVKEMTDLRIKTIEASPMSDKAKETNINQVKSLEFQNQLADTARSGLIRKVQQKLGEEKFKAFVDGLYKDCLKYSKIRQNGVG